jgi:hypothetical protein
MGMVISCHEHARKMYNKTKAFHDSAAYTEFTDLIKRIEERADNGHFYLEYIPKVKMYEETEKNLEKQGYSIEEREVYDDKANEDSEPRYEYIIHWNGNAEILQKVFNFENNK